MKTSDNKTYFLFKDVKEYNKYLLTFICCSILVLVGIISYLFNDSYAKWNSSYISNNVLKLSIKIPKLDESGANIPLLASNMIPVYYDDTSNVWKKADSNNRNENYKWYDYDNKIWANAVTVTSTNRATYLSAKAGTTIPMSDINTMWVWIPRYTYTYLNTTSVQEIQIRFESDTNSSGTIKCADYAYGASGASVESEWCSDSRNGTLKTGVSRYTHPAFWLDKNDDSIRTDDEELTGIWVGKFEVSSNITCTVSDGVGLGYGCNLHTIRPLIKPNVKTWGGAQVATYFNGMYNMRESGNQYGFSTSDETHMMKNSEWGAVTYLSHSKYGINKEVAINSANTYTTGCGPQSAGSTSSGATCNSYTTTLGQSASTTGNIYGIYDMSGGSEEYMMADAIDQNGKMLSGYSPSSNQNSGFSGELTNSDPLTGNYEFPNKKYYDKYGYSKDNTTYLGGKLGDATKEMSPYNGFTWYSGNAGFLWGPHSWFTRGGDYSDGVHAGIFNFFSRMGHADSNFSSRASLIVLK